MFCACCYRDLSFLLVACQSSQCHQHGQRVEQSTNRCRRRCIACAPPILYRCSYSVESANGKSEEREASLEETDPLWCELRHMFIAEVGAVLNASRCLQWQLCCALIHSCTQQPLDPDPGCGNATASSAHAPVAGVQHHRQPVQGVPVQKQGSKARGRCVSVSHCMFVCRSHEQHSHRRPALTMHAALGNYKLDGLGEHLKEHS